MNFRFHPSAEAELYVAQDWYEEQRGGLGREFLTAVIQAIDTIRATPRAFARWPGTSAEVRRLLVKRFPYALPYIVGSRYIEILAVAHTRRRPLYWLDRLQ